MILAFANASTKNSHFDSAYGRSLKDRQVLQSRLKAVEIDGRFNTLGFVIGDYPLNFFKVNLKADESLFQIFVGYDLAAIYARDQDEKVIQMFAGWLRRIFQETNDYAPKRQELLEIVNSWEREVVRRIVGERVTT